MQCLLHRAKATQINKSYRGASNVTILYSLQTRRGHREDAFTPPPDLKRNLISSNIIAKILFNCTLLAKDAKIWLMVTISQIRLLRFIRRAGLVCGTWYKIVNDRMGVRRAGRQNGNFSPAWILGLRTIYLWKKNWSGHLISD